MLRRFWRIGFTVVIAALLVLAGVGLYFAWGLEEGRELKVGNVDPESLRDGVFFGRFEHGRWSNEVKVEIKNHRIKKIDVVEDMLVVDKDIANQIFNRVIQRQNTDVDVVTGATVTSKAYLKAIENALVSRNEDP